jgi:hypothetical protein
VAILTLRKVGLDSSRLIASLEKIERFNDERFGIPVNAGSYPTVSDRKKAAVRVLKWMR